MAKKPKGKTLGPLFASTLATLEYCETVVEVADRIDEADIPFNVDNLGDFCRAAFYELAGPPNTGDGLNDKAQTFLQAIIERWANDANDLREAFKFQGQFDDMAALGREAVEPMVVLPFDRVCVIVNNVGKLNDETARRIAEKQADAENETVVCIESFCIYGEVRTLPHDDADDEWYRSVGLHGGDEFISLTFSFVEAHNRLNGLVPTEVHLTIGDRLDGQQGPRWCIATPKDYPELLQGPTHRIAEMAAEVFCTFLCALEAQRAKQVILPGIKVLSRPTKKRKRRKYEFYEHTLLTIDPTKPLPARRDGFGSGRKHKLHPVRAHWRTYKSGKRVRVAPHWRGDKDLGVITHDYEVKQCETVKRKSSLTSRLVASLRKLVTSYKTTNA